MMERVSNYEITKRRVQGEFIKYDQQNMIDKFSLEHDDDFLYIKHLGYLYRINRKSGLVEWLDKAGLWIEGDFDESLTIYDLLCDSKENCHASGDYINLISLSALQSSSKKLGDGLFDGKDQIFDHKEELLCKICEKLGGTKAGKGDVAYEIPIFDFVKCRIQFWNSDDEFEAQLQVFMDKNILQFIRYETVWYVVTTLMKRLTEGLEEKCYRN